MTLSPPIGMHAGLPPRKLVPSAMMAGALAALLVAILPSIAFGQRAVALEGELAPGTGGGTFQFFGRPAINDTGTIAFNASIAGGTAGGGVFVETSGIVSALVVAGDPAPDSGGGRFTSSFSGTTINDAGDVAFTAQVTGGTAGSGTFRVSGGTLSAAAVEGQVAPDTGGGTYGFFFNPPALSASGDVVFSTSVFGSSVFSGIFRDSGGVDSAVSRAGDAVAGLPGQTYQGFGSPSINRSGEIVFYAELDGSLVNGLFRDDAPEDTVIVLAGDPVADVAGATFSLFFFDPPGFNARGEIGYNALLDNSPGFSGLFEDTGSGDSLVVRNGDIAPDTGGGTFGFFSDNPTVNDFGITVFRVGVDSGTTTSGLFAIPGTGAATILVVQAGDAAPDTGGGTFASFDARPSINTAGETAFNASISGGTTNRGVFAVPEPTGFLPGLCALALIAGRARRLGRDGPA